MVQTLKREIGNIGEDIAVKHFVKHSFKILDRNYLKKWGEIDIVAKKDNTIHFVEVKTVSSLNISGDFKPEENLHPWKRKRLARTIETYIADKEIDETIEWQVDILAVFLNFKTRRAKIRLTENILL